MCEVQTCTGIDADDYKSEVEVSKQANFAEMCPSGKVNPPCSNIPIWQRKRTKNPCSVGSSPTWSTNDAVAE